MTADTLAIITALSTVVLAAITAVYVVFTGKILRENRLLRELQYQPMICCYLEISQVGVNFINLIIENRGPGPALDVSFTLKWTANQELVGSSLPELGILQRETHVMPPGWRLSTFIASMLDGFDELIRHPIEIVATAKDQLGKPHQWIYVLDFESFKNVSRIGSPPLQAMAKSLEKISKGVEGLASGQKSLNVVTETDREARAFMRARRIIGSNRQAVPNELRRRIKETVADGRYWETLEVLAQWEERDVFLIVGREREGVVAWTLDPEDTSLGARIRRLVLWAVRRAMNISSDGKSIKGKADIAKRTVKNDSAESAAP